MFSDVILVACGLVLFLTGVLVLTNSHTAEVSTRSVAALLFSLAGLWCMARVAMAPPVPLGDLALPIGVSIWLLGALWRRRGHPMRRVSDWSGEQLAENDGPETMVMSRGSWLGPERKGRSS